MLLEPYRTAGDKQITPDSDVLTAARDTGHTIVGVFKFCVDETGQVTRVVTLQSTQVPSYDQKVIRKMKLWAYSPIVVDGRATAVCGAITFKVNAH
jgi:TonB family protein